MCAFAGKVIPGQHFSWHNYVVVLKSLVRYQVGKKRRKIAPLKDLHTNPRFRPRGMTSSVFLTMASWTSDKFRLSCLDNQGLKRALLKMLILDSSNSGSTNGTSNGGKSGNIESDRTAAEYLVDQGAPNNKSLLSFFAINALELSAPASPVLLERNAPAIPSGWLQLSGHPKR